jgi:hypothetical protein
MVLVSLLWPRPLISERTAVKTLRFQKNAVDLSAAGWTERILFKEAVQGPFGMEISVTEQLSSEEVDKFFSIAGASLFKLAGSEVAGMVTSTMGAGLLKVPFQYLKKRASSSDDRPPRIIAAGTADVSLDDSWLAGTNLEIPLQAPGRIYRCVQSRRHGTATRKRRRVLEAGEQNGVVRLTGMVYG